MCWSRVNCSRLHLKGIRLMSILGKRVWGFFPPSTSSTLFVEFQKYGLQVTFPCGFGLEFFRLFQAF